MGFGVQKDRVARRLRDPHRVDGVEKSQRIVFDQVIEQFQLGIGSALSVLLFLSVLVVAAVIVKLFRVDLAAARQEG